MTGYPRLLREVAKLYRAAGVPMLRVAAEILARFDTERPKLGSRSRKPVCRFAGVAIDAARKGPLKDIADAFAIVEPVSDWVQNPNYGGDKAGKGFLDNYGYVEFVGPNRAYESHELLVGFLMLGPDTLYPDHGHAAEEIYHVASGRAEWWRQGQEWRVEQPGTAIHHKPHQRHAMRAAGEPLLALYCWRGEIGTAARLSREPAKR